MAGEARPKQVHPGKQSRIRKKKIGGKIRDGPPPSWGKEKESGERKEIRGEKRDREKKDREEDFLVFFPRVGGGPVSFFSPRRRGSSIFGMDPSRRGGIAKSKGGSDWIVTLEDSLTKTEGNPERFPLKADQVSTSRY